MKPTGVPDGSQEMAKVTRPHAIDRTGRKDPNIADNLPETMDEPMVANLRKGAHGGPSIAGKGPTIMPDETEFVPAASDEGAVEKFGLGHGKFGAI